MERLFRSLKKELKSNYGITKHSINFIPFEDWRIKLKDYFSEFEKEYMQNIDFLKKKFHIDKLKKVSNQNKKIILFSGIPGAGKTTLAEIIRNSLPNTILLTGHDIVDYLNLFGKDVEEYRSRLKKRGFNYPDPWYISYLYQEQLTKDCLNLGYNVIFDDHIRTRKNRDDYYKLAKQNNSNIIFIQIEAPFQTFLDREEGQINKKKINFLANFIFQSQDFNKEEKNKFFKIIEIDATSNLNKIKKYVLSELK